METLANLESFVRSAETGGFSAAARRAPAHIGGVPPPSYLRGRPPPADPSGLASFDGIVMRSSKTRRVRERPMRNAAGDEMAVLLKTIIAFDDPEAMCQAAVLGL